MSDYTIGWICAIEPEHVAAQEFLDEEHEGPECVSERDHNVYTLGKIGKHNVVIAVLPNGEYGLAAAGNVANDMLHSFPNVRIGLMVGIGGGAPSPDHDIRLGDIVVSSPHNGQGSVFQYDFGKEIQGQGYRYTRLLNEPPTVLNTAVTGLKARYRRRGHQLKEAINSVLEKNPRLRNEYKRPDPHTDRLYQASHIHPQNVNKVNCPDACGNDPLTLVQRPDRTEDEDIPKIHYGIIASGNTLMKNAEERDRLVREKNVLCFETEAAGLRKDFPCLVIRGICDYSDSHKNKEWQGYAAMAAAAYAKDLLHQIAPSRVEAERVISDILSSVEKDVNEMRGDVKDLGFEQRRQTIERWLSPPDPSTNYNRALLQHQEGTGLWLLQSDAFTDWKTRRNSFLWLYGIPGCGKTVLSSAIMKHLTSATPPFEPLLYFYFDFTDNKKQSLEDMVRSLIKQLYGIEESTRRHLDSLFASCRDGKIQPRMEQLSQCILHMIQQTDEVWIVLDALDECNTRNQGLIPDLFSWVKELQNPKSKVHLLVTSRPEEDIRAEISKYASAKEVIRIKAEAINGDIRAYVQTRIRKGEGLERWRRLPEVQDEIETRVVEKSCGMFRWAALQLDTLKKCLDYPDLREALTSLPDTLDQTYTRILNAIDPRHKKKAIRILQFLAFSERPLRLEELVDAIVVDTQRHPWFNPANRMPKIEEISIYCSALVVVSSKTVHRSDWSGEEMNEIKELQLSHLSVKEYLTSERIAKDFAHNFQEVAAKASIATVCLAYLLHLDQDISIYGIGETFPLAQYSARYWMSHALVAECTDGKLQDFIEKLFCHHRNSYWNWCNLYQPDWPRDYEPAGSVYPTPALYYASFGGLVNAVQYVLSQGADVNEQGGRYGTALQAASLEGHEKVVELLLANGVDVNAPGGYYGTALYAASSRGHEKVVELLLAKGTDVNAQGGEFKDGGTALYAASSRGHEKVVELLLAKGADVNAPGGDYGTALEAASYKGHKKVVELLLANGAGINEQGGFYGTALQKASSGGHKKVVELLLAKGAHVNAQDEHDGTSLYAASSGGHEKVVELLLANGADANPQDRFCPTALKAASSGGHEKVVRLLLATGVDVNAQDEVVGYGAPDGVAGYSALQIASFEGHEKVVELLLANGADANAQAGCYGTALFGASYGGHKKVVELLLAQGADANTQYECHGTPLYIASSRGHEKVVELLLANGADAADANVQDRIAIEWVD